MTAGGVASLPMYDRPELRGATDRLWSTLREALREEGMAAPEALERGRPMKAVWEDPRLVLSMACGLPLVRGIAAPVAVLGAFDYGVAGAPPGHYRSVVVVRGDDPRGELAAFRGARLALNGYGSQSGWGAILHHAAPLARDGRFFGPALVTGAHAASGRAVAEGAADIAAVDAVSWRLMRRFVPEAAGRLRVLMETDPTPGLPLIAAPGTDVARARRALAAGVAGLEAEVREALGLGGFVALDRADYAVILERITAPEESARRGVCRGVPS